MEEGKYYKIVGNRAVPGLVQDVNAMIEEGWVPCGGPYERDNLIFQAMVRITQEDIDEKIRKVFDK